MFWEFLWHFRKTGNDMEWESDFVSKGVWGRVYNGSEKRSALIGFDGYNICIALCHLWDIDIGVVYYGILNALQIRVIIHEWLSALEMSILQMRLAWHEEILWSLVKKPIFDHKKALLHFHMVRDFLTSEILAGQMFTLELMDVALKWHPPPLCEVHRCPVATGDTRKRLQVVTGTANKCSDWPCLCLYDVALKRRKNQLD